MEIVFRGETYEAPLFTLGKFLRVMWIEEKMRGILEKLSASETLEDFDKAIAEVDNLFTEKIKTSFGDRCPAVKRSDLSKGELEALESFFVNLAEEILRQSENTSGTSPASSQSTAA